MALDITGQLKTALSPLTTDGNPNLALITFCHDCPLAITLVDSYIQEQLLLLLKPERHSEQQSRLQNIGPFSPGSRVRTRFSKRIAHALAIKKRAKNTYRYWTVRLWNSASGELRATLSQSFYVNWVAYSPQGRHIAVAVLDWTVQIWDVTTEENIQELQGHNDQVQCVAYSPNGQQTASCADTSDRILSPRNQVASSSIDMTVRLWDVESGTCHIVLTGHLSAVISIAYSLKGEQIVSGSSDSSVKLWDVETGRCFQTLTGHTNSIDSVAYSPNGTQVASGSTDMMARLWDVSGAMSRFTPDCHSSAICGIRCSPEGDMVASCSSDRTIRLWDSETGDCRKTLSGHGNSVFSIAFSPQGDRMVSGSDVIASASCDMTVRLWDVATGDCFNTLNGHSDEVMAVAYSPNGDMLASRSGRLLASGSRDMTVRLRDVATGQCQAEIENFRDAIFGIAWDTTSDDGYLFTDSGNGSVIKWQVTREGDLCSVRLLWYATNGTLSIAGASFQDARGLTPDNKQLLKQRGAIGEPEHLLRGSRWYPVMTDKVDKQLGNVEKIAVGNVKVAVWIYGLSSIKPEQHQAFQNTVLKLI
ncbi:MAG: WD40-repeat-containing domain protein [Benniella sp.]|nr:MAG: WD40-repeat-containing domain protein [Benniella sp.]